MHTHISLCLSLFSLLRNKTAGMVCVEGSGFRKPENHRASWEGGAGCREKLSTAESEIDHYRNP